MKILIYILLLLFPFIGSADNDIEFSKFIEQLSDDTKQSIQLEILEEYYNDKMNLITAKKTKLVDIGLSISQARLLLEVLASNDTILTVDQLFSFLKLSTEQESILLFCTFIERKQLEDSIDIGIKYRTRIYTKLSPIRGFAEDIYQGSKYSAYNRLLIDYGSIKVGFTGSKDIGEQFLFDSYNFFGEYSSDDLHIIAGDFYIKMGTGTVLWNPFSFRKGFNTLSPIEQYDNSANVFRSATENSSFRGLYGSWSTSLFNSKVNMQAWRSGNTRSGTINDDGSISSIYGQGLYRYETELNKRDKINEMTYGLGLNVSGNSFTVGYGIVNFDYSAPIRSKSSSAYSGKSGLLHTLHLNHQGDAYKLISEYSKDAKNNNAFKLGSIYFFEEIETAIYYRYFDSGFRSQYGFMFGELSFPANEEGLYFALNYKQENVNVLTYFDMFRSLEPVTNMLQPMNGIDVMGRIEYKPIKRHYSALSLRYEDKSREYERHSLDIDGRISRYILRAEYKFDLTKNYNILLRSDLTYTQHSHLENENGIFFLVQNRLKIFKNSDTRFNLSYFNTDSYYSAVWQNDYIISGKMYNTPLIGKGIKVLVNLRYNLSKLLVIQATLTDLIKYSNNKIGSGYDEIIGNEDLRIYLQLDVKIR